MKILILIIGLTESLVLVEATQNIRGSTRPPSRMMKDYLYSSVENASKYDAGAGIRDIWRRRGWSGVHTLKDCSSLDS